LGVFTSAIMVVFVNISLLTTSSFTESDDQHSVTNTHLSTISHNFSVASAARGGSNVNSNGDNNNNNAEKPRQQQQQPKTNNVHANDGADQGRKNKKQVYTVDEKLMRILRHVGIQNSTQLSEDDRQLLPTWDEVVDRVGNNGPKILGLETCKAYRAAVSTDKRMLGVAGPFNSGTHYLNEVMSQNCIYKRPNKPNTKGNKGVLNQVPWGKHQSPRFRLVHNTQLGRSIDKANDQKKAENNGQLDHPKLPPDLEEFNRNVLPVVMVRDPFTWWQSMCKSRYSAHWFHVVPDHCPNFIANNVEKEWFFKNKLEVRKHYEGDPWKVDNVVEKANYTLDKKVVPLWVRYHSENWQHKSLAHMWTDWYKDYYDAEYPRLMIRLEDLVFYPHETLRQVCECAIGGGGGDATDTEDGYFEYVGDENLVLSLDSAIRGNGNSIDNIHGKDRTGLLGAMAKHAGPYSVSHRATGMTKEDLEFAAKVLKDSDTMSFFGYKVPLESHLKQNRNNNTK
jgi:hypothetical protein